MDWEWQVTDNARDNDVIAFMQTVYASLPRIADFLQQPTDDSVSLGENLSLSKYESNEFFLEYRGCSETIQLHGDAAKTTKGYFSPGSTETAWIRPRLTGQKIDALIPLFNRLRIGQQRDFICIVWPMPWHWNRETCDDRCIEAIMDGLRNVWGARCEALWPQGFANSPARPWYLDEEAYRIIV